MDITLQYFENAKMQLKNDKERRLVAIKENVMREVQPKCVEIEQLKVEEINKLANDYNSSKSIALEQYNAQLTALQKKFEDDKKSISEIAEKRKAQIIDTTLQEKSYEIVKVFDKAIEDLDILIAKRTKKE